MVAIENVHVTIDQIAQTDSASLTNTRLVTLYRHRTELRTLPDFSRPAAPLATCARRVGYLRHG